MNVNADKLAEKKALLDVNKGLFSGVVVAIQAAEDGYRIVVDSSGLRAPIRVRRDDPVFATAQTTRGDYVVVEVEYQFERGFAIMEAAAMVNTTRRIQRKGARQPVREDSQPIRRPPASTDTLHLLTALEDL